MRAFTDHDTKIIEQNMLLKPKQLMELLEGDYTSEQITKKKNYIKNKVKYLKNMESYRKTESFKTSQKKWRTNNLDKEKLRHKKWRLENHDYDVQRRRNYRKALKEKYNIPDRWGGKGQALVKGVAEEILESKALEEFSFDWLVSTKGYLMPVDLYFPDYNLVIEYNGQQHYFPVDFGGGEEDAKRKFESQKARDRYKYKLIREKGINLLVVPYNLGMTKLRSLIYMIREERDKYEQTDYESCPKKTRLKCRKK